MTVVLAGAAGDAGAALRFGKCGKDVDALGDAGCATVHVPLDRSGTVPGTLSLRVARAGTPKRGGKALFALAGGPGQPGAFIASFARDELGRAIENYTVYGLDQRGTGASGVISCPRLQSSVGTSDFAVPSPGSVEACGESVGARRGFYPTTATVEDLEAVRRALGVSKIAIVGVSYGTYVAERYARTYPARVDRLVLDSVVSQENVDPLARSNIAQVRTNLQTACTRGRCRGITSDPVGDVTALVRRMPVRGPLYDDRGRRRTAAIPDGADLLDGIVTTTFSEELDRAHPCRRALGARRRPGAAAAPAARDAPDERRPGELAERGPARRDAVRRRRVPVGRAGARRSRPGGRPSSRRRTRSPTTSCGPSTARPRPATGSPSSASVGR